MQGTAQENVMLRHSETQFIICPVHIWGDNVPAHHLLIPFLALSMLSLPLSSRTHPQIFHISTCANHGSLSHPGTISSITECLIMDYWCSCGMEAAQNPPGLAVWDILGCQKPLTALVCAGPPILALQGGSSWPFPHKKVCFNSKISQELSPSHSAELSFV